MINMTDVIILRSVFGKVGQKYFLQPCPNPKTGRFSSCVKSVDTNGDMILSESEKEELAAGTKHFIKLNELFVIEDGFKLDMADITDKAIWDAIKYSQIIAKDRNERDENGILVIDGGAKKYGIAELFVERPGEIVRTRVTKKQKIFEAQRYIYEDSESERIKKCRVLGRDLSSAPSADVLDYMLSISEKNPEKIVELYEDDGWKMHLFIITAIERGVIKKVAGVYSYDDKVLGGSVNAVINVLQDIRYNAILKSIKRETYPEYSPITEQEKMAKNILEGTGIPVTEGLNEELENASSLKSEEPTELEKPAISKSAAKASKKKV